MVSRIVVTTLVCLAGADAVRADAKADDGSVANAKKVSWLVSQGRCDLAIRELTRAYEATGVDSILFERAECYRKVGDNGNAIADYLEILKVVPQGEIRRGVEKRVVELLVPAGGDLSEPVAAKVPPTAERTPRPSGRVGGETAPPSSLAALRGSRSGQLTTLVDPFPDARNVTVTKPAPAPEPPEPEAASSSTRSKWLWAAVAFVALGAATVGWLAIVNRPSSTP